MISDKDHMVSPHAATVDATAARDDLVGATLGHYRIVSRLGQGGMGVVYRAEDEKLRRTVALKVLPDAGDAERRQRFLREARSAAAITHPNVAVVYAVDEALGHVYIAMELVDGENLRAHLNWGQLDAVTRKGLAEQIARGLAAAHEKGIVHRDLKPENIMITPAGAVKLLDFGLAKPGGAPSSGQMEAALARTETVVTSDEGRIMGTPEYMSPEQAMGEPLDVRSDVFSLGIVLYEMLSGTRPFAGSSTGAVLVAIARDPAPPLRQRAPDVDEATAAVVMRCLGKAPGDRFGNAAEVATALSGQTSPRATTQSRTDVQPLMRSRSIPPRPARGPAAALFVGAVAVLGLGSWWLATRGPRAVAPAATPTNSSALAAPSGSSRPTLHARRMMQSTVGSLLQGEALSPDGSQLVFSDTDGVWVQPVTGGSPRPLSVPRLDGGLAPAISFLPDGRHVFVAATSHLWIAPLDGGAAQRLPDRGEASNYQLSPDGTQLAIVRDRAISIAPLDGSTPARTVAAVSDSFQALPNVQFSPDGTHVAYIDESGTKQAIFVARSDGGGSTKALDGMSGLWMGYSPALAWPEPDRIVFGAKTGAGTCAVREITVDGDGHATAAPVDLWTTRTDVLYGLVPVRERMAVITANAETGVYLARLTPDGLPVATRRLWKDRRNQGSMPYWMRDGRIAFVSRRDGPPAIYAQRLDEAEPTLVVSPPLATVAQPLQAALRTGELLYERSTEGESGAGVRLFSMVPGAGERALDLQAKSSIGQKSSTYYPLEVRCGAGESSRCVAARWSGSSLVLFRVDLGGGGDSSPPFATIDCPTPDLDVAPDGKLVALACNEDRVRVVTVADGSVRTFTTLPKVSKIQSVSFTPDGRSLVVSGIMGEKATYLMLEVALDGHGHVVLSSNSSWYGSHSISPDGKTLAWYQTDYDSEIWVLEPGGPL